MKNRLRGLGNKKKIEIAAMAEVVGGEVMRIHENFNNVDYFLSVESSYLNPLEGQGESDAVLFQMSQVSKGIEEIDSVVSVSVKDARSFAQAILDTCDEIEKVAEPKCTIKLLEKEHLPGAFIVEVVTPECKRTIHHYSDKSRAEYVDDLVRRLELSGVSYVVNKSEEG